jgi:hypothetical protein
MKTELTDIGFKRVYNKKNKLLSGHERAFVKCRRRKCNTRAAYDFVPFSLSSPILTTPCGHSLREDYKPF